MVDTAGNLYTIPIVEPPTALVTELTVDAAVTFVACGSPNEVTFRGSITTNGPATVTYHWEVNGDEHMLMPEESIELSEAGTQKVTTDMFSADCGEYSVVLQIRNPDEKLTEKPFKIQAP